MLQMHMACWDLKNEPVQSSTMRRLRLPEREDFRNDKGKEKKQKKKKKEKTRWYLCEIRARARYSSLLCY